MEILSTHEEIEDLMELYLLDYSSLESNAQTMQARIDSVEGLVSCLNIARLFSSYND